MLDRLGRPLGSLRVSVTDRCNLRCRYCMPEEEYVWLPREQILSFEEIARVVRELGVRRVRLTGGEPLLRRNLVELVGMLRHLDDLALTTNGVLLAELARPLRAAGLKRITVSLDTLRADRFQALAQRDLLKPVLEGIRAAKEAGFEEVKLDTVVMRGWNHDELPELLAFARRAGVELRFIEYMDVGGATRWSWERVVSREEILAALPPARALPRTAAPAQRFRLEDGTVFGIIASTTTPFCRTCDRARLTADGRLFTCLYAVEGTDLLTPLRDGHPLKPIVDEVWKKREDRGAEQRLQLPGRSSFVSLEALRRDPHLEMHTRGG